MLLKAVERMKFNTDLVLRLCLVDACGFRESLKDMAVKKLRKQRVFFQGECIIKFLFYL